MKILIVRLGSLGDIIHTIPAQQRIRQHLAEAEIHWLTEPPYLPLLRCVPGISRLWTADTKGWRRNFRSWRQFPRLLSRLRREGFDVALDFQGLVKSAFLARLSGAGKVVGLPADELRESAAGWFYTERKEYAGNHERSSRHVIDINLQLASRLGCSGPGSPLIPLQIPDEAQRYVHEQLDKLGVQRPVLFNLGAGWKTKLWPPERFARLFLALRDRHALPVIFSYGPGEESLLEDVKKTLAPLAPPSFPTDMLELAALCRRALLFVGADTGPLHLAVALGTPTVAIMGATAPSRNGPYNPEDLVVTSPDAGPYTYKRKGEGFGCANISVEEVYQAVLRRLERIGYP